ncbi:MULTISPECIES: hypothetical protein [unclassified Pseudomonas]|uniref:hypothetical protein n=1 Tax=unclassified Pseudomonas TaxID=196821 RepID=UPI000A1EE81F|nr:MULTISPECIES: hypothetical protein [unclassified Pseudomonas]
MKTYGLDKIEKLGGTITFDDISKLNKTIDISLMIDDLKENLFQASFPLGMTIDIGWYPEFSEYGSFRITLIENSNWEIPIYSKRAKNWEELDKAIIAALEKIK